MGPECLDSVKAKYCHCITSFCNPGVVTVEITNRFRKTYIFGAVLYQGRTKDHT